jgi:hypothetical protein
MGPIRSSWPVTPAATMAILRCWSGSAQVAILARIMTGGPVTGDTAVVDELGAPDLAEHQFGLAGMGAVA